MSRLARSQQALKLFSEVDLPHPWCRQGWCLYRCTAARAVKVAAFDFDKTLYFGGPSWKLTSAQIPKRLQQLQQFGYTVVIFSNQQGPGRQTSSERMQLEVAKLLSNFEDFYDFVRVDLQIFVSTARGDIGDPFRKPNTGMWKLFRSLCFHLNDLAKVFMWGTLPAARATPVMWT
ncbi:unnamed protein product [Durusdinium trenchii]|uniref:Bifunctional polynucleotide phosphatase/kinase n=1 Tax=Durusdinium trenchii TaxID=1381693 RepID=A0ABP0LUG1_9DINO